MHIPKEIAEATIGLLQPYTNRKLSIEDLEDMLNSRDQRQPTDDRLLSRKEAAHAFNVSLPTVDRMLHSGELERCRIRGRVMIRRSEVNRVLQRKK